MKNRQYFKKGDSVKIINCLRDFNYEPLASMEKYVDTTAKIVSNRGSTSIWYSLDNNNYVWKNEWLEKLDIPDKTIIPFITDMEIKI